jgi:hypothetical protein
MMNKLIGLLLLAACACKHSPGGAHDGSANDLAVGDAGGGGSSGDGGGDGGGGGGTGCSQNSDCQTNEFCDWTPAHACGRDGTKGVCRRKDYQGAFCPLLAIYVCGCDGQMYDNGCVASTHGASIDYGGPCRSGDLVACGGFAGTTCPMPAFMEQFCVDDPRDSCDPLHGGADCPGVCVHGAQVCQDQSQCPKSWGGEEACISPGQCIYTVGLSCQAQTDCAQGQLCLPLIGCSPVGPSCPGACVKP